MAYLATFLVSAEFQSAVESSGTVRDWGKGEFQEEEEEEEEVFILIEKGPLKLQKIEQRNREVV